MSDYLISLLAGAALFVILADPESGLASGLKQMYQQYAFLMSIPW